MKRSAKKARPLARKAAPIKATSGAGFAVEDKVAAVAAAAMMAERSPFPQCPGRLVRISFQVHPDHWDFDDLLLKLERDNGSYHAALSIKSREEITTKAMSADVKDPLGAQFSRVSPNPFRRGVDRLALVSARHDAKVASAIQSLCAAAVGDAAALARRVNEKGLFSPAARAIYQNLQGHLTAHAVPADAATVLASFDHIELDMQDYARPEPMAGRQLCAELLHDPSESNISGLWQALVAECQRQKQLPGYLDLERVLAVVRPRFRLKAYPHDAPDWAIIDRESRGQLALVVDTIAGQVVPRKKAKQSLRDALATHPITALVGPSGCGKSSLVKQFLAEAGRGVQVWTKASRWPQPQAGTLANALGLEGVALDLGDIFRRVSEPGVLVIDAVEHCVDTDRIAQLARVIRLARPDAANTPWRVVLLARVEDWSRVRERLAAAAPEITVHMEPLTDFEPDDVAVIARAVPGLAALLRQPRLETVLRKPKVLALVAGHMSAGGKVESRDLAGESHLAQWWWRERVRTGAKPALRTRALEELVTKQAERVQHAVPEAAFEATLLDSFEELRRDDICVSVEQEYAVQHDLYADWTRLQILIREDERWTAYASTRLDSPLWHRAVRLYGIWLLEQPSGAAAWAKQVNDLAEGDVASRLIADLFLEAPLLSAAPAENLRLVWPDLVARGGNLLHRMLERMRQTGTFPHEPLIELLMQESSYSRGEITPHFRVPYPQYWLPLLVVLHEHLEEAAKLAPLAVARTALAWLQFAPAGWAGRRQAAELAVAVSKPFVTGPRRETWFAVPAEEETIYQAMLAAVAECPGEVARLCRVLSGLEPASGGKFGPERWVRIKEGFGAGEGVRYELPPPWPGGPFIRPKTRFQRLVLNTNALIPVIEANPALARELLLAAHIPEREVERGRDRNRYQPEGMTYDDSFETPFYTRGSYLQLLNSSREEGLRLVVDLVNHFTDRWAEWTRGESQLTIGEGADAQVWKGDQRLYFAYRGISPCHPHVASALMALEKHLLDRLAKGESVEDDVDHILANSRSLAFAGLLVAIGKTMPTLLFGKLWRFVASPEIQVSEFPSIDQIRPEGAMPLPQRTQTLLDEWNRLLVHQVPLHEYCRQQVPYDDVQKKLAGLAARWRELLKDPDKLLVDAFTLQKLAEVFDATNYIRTNEGPKERWDYQPPQKLLAEAAERSKQRRDDLLPLMTLPIHCRTLLNRGEVQPEGELECLYALLDQLPAGELRDEDGVRTTAAPADAQCAIIATLVNLGDGWLDRHPEKAKRCGDIILNALASPPATQSFMADQTGLTWESFAAEAAPYFLAREPASPVWRAATAELVSRPHLATVRGLFRRVGGLRTQLGPLFPQIFNLAVLTAAAQHVVDLDETAKTPALDWPTWWQAKKAEFVGSSLPAPPDDWQAIDVGAGPGRHRDARFGPNIKVGTIVGALDAMSLGGPPTDQKDRERVHAWHRNLLAAIISSLPKTVPKSGPQLPSDSVVRAMILLGAHLAGLEAEVQRRAYWEPLLARGVPATHCIRYFIQAFLSAGARQPTDTFTKGWQEILAWAEATAGWSFSGKEPAYEIRSLWRCLLALEGMQGSAFGSLPPTVVTGMKAHYERWARHNLAQRDGVQRFINFLRLPAAIGLLGDGLCWLDQSLDGAPEKQWLFGNLASELSDFLQWAWSNHEKRIRADLPAFAAFRRLLMNLAAEQDQGALALLAGLSST